MTSLRGWGRDQENRQRWHVKTRSFGSKGHQRTDREVRTPVVAKRDTRWERRTRSFSNKKVGKSKNEQSYLTTEDSRHPHLGLCYLRWLLKF